MRFEMEYGKSHEKYRIAWELKNLAWYKSQGYKDHPLGGIAENASEEEVVHFVEQHYDDKIYAAAAEALRPKLDDFAPKLTKALEGVFGQVSEKIIVKLTQYGGAGHMTPRDPK